MNPAPVRLLLLAGPTAVGKSEIALRLAESLPGEIISVDSMQVYRGLVVGTAKPSRANIERVPHHLVDIMDLGQTFDAAQFARRAHALVTEIQARNRVPILCGGTGLYFQAFLQGLGGAPMPDLKLRAQLETIPLSELLAELKRDDPSAWESIDHNNRRRIVRAIEVLRLTGQSRLAQRARWGDGALPSAEHAAGFVLHRAADDLRRRIDARVDRMFELGLVDETERLLKDGLENNLCARQALGYRQVIEHLRGNLSLPATIELVKTRTWQFAKRQMTWFRKYARWQWLALNPDTRPADTAREIMTQYVRD